jgi:uncharacterized protein YndB with AHSA1/START domain
MSEITITRVFDAPRELVWRAWTEPERLATWWGKRGWNARLDSIVIEPRPGGLFRVTTINADGAEMTTEGRVAEIVEPERLAFADGGSVTLTELPGGRTRMVFRTTVTSAAAEGGIRSAFDRLAEHLSPERTSP